MTSEGSNSTLAKCALLPGLIVFAVLAWKLEFLCDDAFISFRYSRHLAEGEGLRYNLTFDAPVEGYSNFLWVVWLALFEKLGVDITIAARLSSALCGALLVYCVTRRASKSFELSAEGTAATGLFMATLPPVAVWATGGLATMPAALLVFLTYDRLLGDPERPRGLQAGMFAALAGLIRADGTVWILMLLGAGALLWWFRGRPRELFRALIQTSAVLVLCVCAHVLWRYSYYGDYLPNTARVKAGFSMHRLARGFDYIAAWLLTLPAIALVLLLSLRRWRAQLAQVWLPAGVVVATTLGYGLWVGGDFMPVGRFLFPAVPFVGLLFAGVWTRFTTQGSSAGGLARSVALFAIASGTLACFDVNVVPESVRSRFHFRQDREWESEMSMRAAMYQRAREWSIQGKALGRVTEPGETLSAGAIGAIGYYSRVDIYDEYGLVTPSVIDAAPPRENSSPGHDVRVSTPFFFSYEPTYAGMLIAPANEPLDWGVPMTPLTRPILERTTVESYPLLESDGATPGYSLRLLRYHPWD